MQHKKTLLALAVAQTLGMGAATADAATYAMDLSGITIYTAQGAGPTTLDQSTATWAYDDVSGMLTQTGGTLLANYQLFPGVSTLFVHSITSLVVGNGAAATAASYSCIEGNFGPDNVGASLCGNYTFGANFLNESTATWGPGTSFSRILGGDDMSAGTPQNLADFNGMTTTSWNGTSLAMSNATATTGFLMTLSVAQTVPVPAAAWLFGSALGILGILGHRRT
jgi:hypothetical protein